MQAWVYKKTGHPSDVLRLEQDWPKPVPKENEILIEVKAAALNPIGYKTISVPPFSYLQKKPACPESDFSGIVRGGKLEGTQFKQGDEVFGIRPAEKIMKDGQGSLAQFIVTESSMIAKKPSNLTFAQAAGFPLAGLTAFTALVDIGGMRTQGPPQNIFINGGSSGTGSFGVQIAKAFGHQVTTTCSGDSYSLVKGLGADTVIDYRQRSVIDELSKSGIQYDLIFDCVGIGAIFDASAKYLVPKGKYVDIAGTSEGHSTMGMLKSVGPMLKRMFLPAFLGGTPRKYVFGALKSDSIPRNLETSVKMLADGDVVPVAASTKLNMCSGRIKPVIDSEYKFADVQQAYARIMSSRAKGKVVVVMD